MPQISFDAAPEPGTVLKLDAQAYDLVAIEPYRRKDGTATTLLHWKTRCTDCGLAFTITTGLVSKGYNRRCSDCSRPRVRVAKPKHRREHIAVQVIAPVDPQSLY